MDSFDFNTHTRMMETESCGARLTEIEIERIAISKDSSVIPLAGDINASTKTEATEVAQAR